MNHVQKFKFQLKFLFSCLYKVFYVENVICCKMVCNKKNWNSAVYLWLFLVFEKLYCIHWAVWHVLFLKCKINIEYCTSSILWQNSHWTCLCCWISTSPSCLVDISLLLVLPDLLPLLPHWCWVGCFIFWMVMKCIVFVN